LFIFVVSWEELIAKPLIHPINMSVLQGYWPYGSFAFGLLPCFVKLKLKSAIYQALKNQLELFMPFKNIIFIAFFIVLL